jgi:hypothetical protein
MPSKQPIDSMQWSDEVEIIKWLDAPDAPGWWAFEGVWDNGPGEKQRCFFFVVIEDDILKFSYKDKPGLLFSVELLYGKWWRAQTPWQETP